jgi:hypothetical protein
MLSFSSGLNIPPIVFVADRHQNNDKGNRDRERERERDKERE